MCINPQICIQYNETELTQEYVKSDMNQLLALS
jgi:hypothetical protein